MSVIPWLTRNERCTVIDGTVILNALGIFPSGRSVRLDPRVRSSKRGKLMGSPERTSLEKHVGFVSAVVNL